jgi:hypothetical protein
MQMLLIATVAVHVLAAVFWAGTTFGLAGTGGGSAAQLFGRQMIAATIAVLSGGYLWSLTHAGAGFGPAEQTLAGGALAAILAAGVQGVLVGPSLRRLRASSDDAAAKARIALAYRISALLLAITLVTMTSARFL